MIDHCTLELTDDKASALGRGPVYPRQARQAIQISELPIRLDRSASPPPLPKGVTFARDWLSQLPILQERQPSLEQQYRPAALPGELRSASWVRTR